MINNNLLEKALIIATKAHEGQTDKAGAPYIFHPIRVSNRCRTEEEKIVSLLHDVIEDTSVTASDLLTEGFLLRSWKPYCLFLGMRVKAMRTLLFGPSKTQ